MRGGGDDEEADFDFFLEDFVKAFSGEQEEVVAVLDERLRKSIDSGSSPSSPSSPSSTGLVPLYYFFFFFFFWPRLVLLLLLRPQRRRMPPGAVIW